MTEKEKNVIAVSYLLMSGFQKSCDIIDENTPHEAERTKKRERLNKMDYVDTIFDWIAGN